MMERSDGEGEGDRRGWKIRLQQHIWMGPSDPGSDSVPWSFERKKWKKRSSWRIVLQFRAPLRSHVSWFPHLYWLQIFVRKECEPLLFKILGSIFFQFLRITSYLEVSLREVLETYLSPFLEVVNVPWPQKASRLSQWTICMWLRHHN